MRVHRLRNFALCTFCALPLSAFAESIPFAVIESVAMEALESVQERSFREGVEYCGYVVQARRGVYAMEPNRGTEDYCDMKAPPYGAIVASYHTHANHDPEYYSEVPSVEDVEGDAFDETYGFVSTPGGRVWLIDPFQDEIFELCGEQCVAQDPNYNAADYGFIPNSFDLESLGDYLSE